MVMGMWGSGQHTVVVEYVPFACRDYTRLSTLDAIVAEERELQMARDAVMERPQTRTTCIVDKKGEDCSTIYLVSFSSQEKGDLRRALDTFFTHTGLPCHVLHGSSLARPVIEKHGGAYQHSLLDILSSTGLRVTPSAPLFV